MARPTKETLLLREQAWRTDDRKLIRQCLTEKDYEAFINVCCNPNLTKEDITRIFEKHKDSNDQFILGRIAHHVNTPKKIFDVLYCHENPWIVREAVRSKQLTYEQAKKAMCHPSRDVRTMLAYNEFLDFKVLEEYAKLLLENKDEDVLNAVVRNRKTPLKVVKEICVHNYDHVAQALYNKSLNEETLSFLYSEFPLDDLEKEVLFYNEKCPEWILKDAFYKEEDIKGKRKVLACIKKHKLSSLYKEASHLLIELECEELND